MDFTVSILWSLSGFQFINCKIQQMKSILKQIKPNAFKYYVAGPAKSRLENTRKRSARHTSFKHNGPTESISTYFKTTI